MNFAVLFGLVSLLLAAFRSNGDPNDGDAAPGRYSLRPRSAQDLLKLLIAAEEGPIFPLPIEPPVDEPALEAVDSETVAAVEAAAAQIAACFATRQPDAGLAGFTDGLVRRLAAASTIDGFRSELDRLADPMSTDRSAEVTVEAAGAGRLTDGRVALRRRFSAEIPGEPAPIRHESLHLFVFAQADGRRLLDDVLHVGASGPGAPWLDPAEPDAAAPARPDSRPRLVVPILHTVQRGKIAVTLVSLLADGVSIEFGARLEVEPSDAEQDVLKIRRATARARIEELIAKRRDGTLRDFDPTAGRRDDPTLPNLVATAEDDLGNAYESVFGGGGGGGQAVWDLALYLQPALAEDARRLRLSVPAVEWRGVPASPKTPPQRTDPGPWPFDIDLAAGKTATVERVG